MTSQDPYHYIWWLGARSAGLVAFGLAAAVVIDGLSMSTSREKRRYAARKVLHEQLALAAVVAVALHGILLLADPSLHPGLAGVVVPFAAPYRPLWTACGIIAAYLIGLLGLTYYARKVIGSRRSRKLHRLMPAIYVSAAVHMLGAGSDRGTLWLRLSVLATAMPIAVMLVLRLRALSGAKGSASARRPAKGIVDVSAS
jgi:methionine sulfoxide reductase heme-binding subunit